MPTNESRYEQISRRAFLRRAAAAGVAAAVPGVILAACGSDAEAFGSAASAGGATATTAAGAAASTTTSETVATATAPSGPQLADGAELVVDFTYQASSSGRGGVKNPYIAVWVEDEAGDLVATVALWFMQGGKGMQWLSDLRRWATIDGSSTTIDTISSATRAPGAYQVVWDGTTAAGTRVAQGNYYIAVEASREHGPYSLIREAITIGDQAFIQDLDAEGELTNAAVSLSLA